MDGGRAVAELTEAERDSLTECECGHYLNEHSSEGCLATVYDDRLDDMCPCMATPDLIRERAIVAMIVARVDAVLAKFEALADDWAGGVGIEGYINLGEAEDALRSVIEEARRG